jgi:hypothetical protein
MPIERIRVLIWGKTYPELSATYTETVCTGGCREDGSPIRLYPVPLRYLDPDQQYSLYHWIELPVEKSTRDPRPESYKVMSGELRVLSKVPTDRDGWRQRREVIFRDSSWHYTSLGLLKAAQQERGVSLGLVTPGEIVDVRKVRRSDAERKEYEAKMAQIQNQADIFRPEYKDLEFPEFDVRLRWRCAEVCRECRSGSHDMKVLDWGLIELGRREGWDSACQKLEEISSLRTHDFRLYMGNFYLHQHNFGILGFWYPRLPEQQVLL